ARVLHSFPTRRSSDLIVLIIHNSVASNTFSFVGQCKIYPKTTFMEIIFMEIILVKGQLYLKFTHKIQIDFGIDRHLSTLYSILRSEEHTSELQSRENL